MAHWLRILGIALTAAVAGASVGYAATVVYLRCCNVTQIPPYPLMGAAVGALLGFTIGWLRRSEARAAT